MRFLRFVSFSEGVSYLLLLLVAMGALGPSKAVLEVGCGRGGGASYVKRYLGPASVVGMDQVETDMSAETAERCVDFALQTSSPGLTIEFQGGEPMANWAVLQRVIEYAQLRQ